MSATWEPSDPAFRADPYPTYETLLEQEPLYQSPYGPLLVSRYEDCLTVLRHPAASKDSRKVPGWSPPPEVPEELFIPSIFSADPPDHTRMRALMNRSFTPRRVEGLRPRMQQIVDEAFDRAAERGSMEVVGELAFPLPATVICEMLGVPTADVGRLRAWSADAVRATDPGFTLSSELLAAHAAAYEHLMAYFRDLIATRRDDPGDDLLSALMKVEQEGDQLSEPELVFNSILLLLAGHETTVNLIANGVLAFARCPEQFDRLRQDLSLTRNAVEEVLRFYPPGHLDKRLPVEDIELSCGTVPAFSELYLVLAAANRDREQFDDPQRFDIARSNNRHLSFGFGIHHCIGAPLARLEGEVVFSTLARRFSTVELLCDPPPYNENVVLPGVASLEARLTV
jgi:cytochrome P450